MNIDIKLDFNNYTFQKFANQCKQQNSDLKLLFKKHVSNLAQGMNIQELGILMRGFQTSLSDFEIQQIFQILDLKQDGKIDQVEFETQVFRYQSANIGIYKIIQEIRKHNIDLNIFFSNFHKFDTFVIDINEFRGMINRILNNLQDNQIELLFRQFDKDGDRIIVFQDFKNTIQKYYYEDTIPDVKIDEVIKKLINSIKKNNLQVDQIFQAYDKSQDQNLDIFEFGPLLRDIDPSFSEKEISLTFYRFDANRDNSITKQEFMDSIQFFYNTSMQQSEKVQTALENLTNQIIQSNYQNLIDIFKKIDTSGDLQLDINEFTILIRQIDTRNQLSSNDIELTFREFDHDGDRNISFQEFQTTLQQTYEEQMKLNKGRQLIQNFQQWIACQGLDSLEVFNQCSNNFNQVQHFSEFEVMVRMMNNSIPSCDIKDAFIIFDTNNDGVISYFEFQKGLLDAQQGQNNSFNMQN